MKKVYTAPTLKNVSLLANEEISNFFGVSTNNTTIYDMDFGGFWEE